ncbi:uncharacterized protein LOC143276545 [Babylonia areolata]|uniref:uncharacterized protein LOC143276545 n=1 Tax=Babylonia areolata TaxID=304850 RepID=UPI003FD56DC9
MEKDTGIHPDSSHAVGDGAPADSPSDLQVSSHSDSVKQPGCDSQTGGQRGATDCETEDVGDGETLQPRHQSSQQAGDESDDHDEEFLSASEGEGDEDNDDDDDDKKLEQWAESLSDLSGDVNVPMPAAVDGESELCSSAKSKERAPAPDSHSDLNTASTSATCAVEEKPEGLGEPSSESSTDSDKQDKSEITSSPSKIRQNIMSPPEKDAVLLPEDTEELVEEAIAAAALGTDEEETREEDEVEKQQLGVEGDTKGDDESKDSEEAKEREKKEKEEEEEERRRQEEEDTWTEEERQSRLAEAVKVKTRGNDTFKSGQHAEALELYTQSLQICPLKYIHQRALMLSNRAACHIKEGDYEAAVKDCSKSIQLDPSYIKAYFRRADAYEKLEKLEEALKDHQKVVEMDRSQAASFHACMRLEKEIQERNEKLKTEMLGKLKDLGNMVLRPFGLSTNNFQLQQDPGTGSYSVQFVQSPPTNGH